MCFRSDILSRESESARHSFIELGRQALDTLTKCSVEVVGMLRQNFNVQFIRLGITQV
jgi:hypothetical protein